MSHELPILFSALMVRAILDGRKTMTRRVLKPVNGATISDCEPTGIKHGIGEFMKLPLCKLQPPKYSVGDTLWVREAWQALAKFDKTKPSDIPQDLSNITYTADRPDMPWDSRKRHGMFMPRWASRIALEVTAVKVLQLQDISAADVFREGIAPTANSQTIDCATLDPRHVFKALWESINGPDSWKANPWVAAYTFNRLDNKEPLP